jgi:NADPH-dependent curcumin reductase CurA
LEEVGKLYSEGKLKYKEDVSHGLENAIDSFIGVLGGGNFGKAMIQVSD